MPDIRIRADDEAGRITLDRAEALNAVTYEMCLEIAKALEEGNLGEAMKQAQAAEGKKGEKLESAVAEALKSAAKDAQAAENQIAEAANKAESRSNLETVLPNLERLGLW